LTDVGEAINGLAGTKNLGAHDQFNLVVWSRRGQSVKQVTFYYVTEAAVYQRRRADETASRLHSWVAVH
jgi:hypothetical protein